MTTATTEGIEVTVETQFRQDQSSYPKGVFLFSYAIRIKNKSPEAVQLLKRHWKIHDSNGEFSEIVGDGVVGEQPVIEPERYHEYESFCNFKTDIGKMKGAFLMQRVRDKQLFEVKIPEFRLEAPFRKN